ncbi:MAG: FtsX-like permease family protein [Methanocella sp. PtaU1.Bin125]|nr:MAG: FtsX-like permease family protein [Methanocella sp. PtaU1.Bin125]
MQSKSVRNTFILETFFLTLFASVVGIIFGLIVTGLLMLIRIDTTSILSILLLDKHLHLVPSAMSIISNLVLILLIAAITAYFPSKKAAKMKAADALRHYE